MSMNFRIKPINIEYPHVIVRLQSCVYQYSKIIFLASKDNYSRRRFEVECCKPFTVENKLTDIALAMLLREAKLRVAQEGFPMCIVIAPNYSFYIELDGTAVESTTAPNAIISKAELEVYDYGLMPIPESVYAEDYFDEENQYLIPPSRTNYRLVESNDGSNSLLATPILLYADLWDATANPFWLLCWLLWSDERSEQAITGYAEFCLLQISKLSGINRNKFSITDNLFEEDSWFLELWMLTESYAKACSKSLNQEDKVDLSLGWAFQATKQINQCFGNPFDGEKRLLLPLTVDEAFKHQMMGVPILTPEKTICFKEVSPFIEDEQC